jgi:hypothetical protein
MLAKRPLAFLYNALGIPVAAEVLTQPLSKQRFAAMPLEFYGISTCISVAWL